MNASGSSFSKCFNINIEKSSAVERPCSWLGVVLVAASAGLCELFLCCYIEVLIVCYGICSCGHGAGKHWENHNIWCSSWWHTGTFPHQHTTWLRSSRNASKQHWWLHYYSSYKFMLSSSTNWRSGVWKRHRDHLWHNWPIWKCSSTPRSARMKRWSQDQLKKRRSCSLDIIHSSDRLQRKMDILFAKSVNTHCKVSWKTLWCQTTKFNVSCPSNIGDMCIHRRMTVKCNTQILHRLFERNLSIPNSCWSR